MNNEEIAKHTGVTVERVNQIEAEEFDRISKAVAPCPVFVESADHERIKVERDGIAKQLADLVRYAANLDDDNDSLREQLEKATLYSITCVHHTDAERDAITCPVCLATQLASAKEERDEARLRLLSAAGDDLCRLTQEEIKAYSGGVVKIPPKGEFLASCERFHAQIAGAAGVLDKCLTLAQLIAENESLREQLATVTKERDELAKDPMGYARVFWRKELAAANERAEKLDRMRDKLREHGGHTQAIQVLIGESIEDGYIKAVDSLLLQLQQEKAKFSTLKEASDDKFADFRKRLGIPVGVGLTDSITDLATARRELQQTQTKLKFMAQAEVDLVNTQEELKQEKERAYAASGILSDICGSLRNQDKTLPLPDQVRDRIATLYAQLLQCQAACVKIREVADVVEIYRSINESVGTERMWSEFQDALSTSPATALAEALESALKEGFEIKDRIWPSNSHNAWIASDTRKKLP